MSFASDVFPQLPSKDLSRVLIKIFLYLNEDEDIHTYRLVNRGWKAFIDNEILSSPVLRSKFLQHPIGLPAEQRKRLIEANLCEDLEDGRCPDSTHRDFILDRGQHVLIATILSSDDLHDRRNVTLSIFRKSNVALKAVGNVELRNDPGLLKRAFAMHQDYLFYLELIEDPRIYLRGKLQVFKNEKNTWNPFQHPARYLWEEEGAQIFGMKQVSDDKVFLLVALRERGLMKVYNLCDGGLELSVNYVYPIESDHLRDYFRICHPWYAELFDVDASSLVIWTDPRHLRHFSFASQTKTWEVEAMVGEPVKSRDATFIHCRTRGEITMIDNATGAVTNAFSYKRVPYHYFPWITPSGNYIIFRSARSGNLSSLGDGRLPSIHCFVVYDVQESKLMFIRVKIPGFEDIDFLLIHDMKLLSDPTVICANTVFRWSNRSVYPAVIILSLAHPDRMIVLPYGETEIELNAIVPRQHGFFVVGHQWSANQPDTTSHSFLSSWKY